MTVFDDTLLGNYKNCEHYVEEDADGDGDYCSNPSSVCPHKGDIYSCPCRYEEYTGY